MSNISLIKVKSITKFSVLDVKNSFERPERTKGQDFTVPLSRIFWKKILSPEWFEEFFTQKYLPNQKKFLTKAQQKALEEEGYYLLKNIKRANQYINFFDNTHPPSADEFYFSYKIYTGILTYLNVYYESSGINVGSRFGIIYRANTTQLDDFHLLLSEKYNHENPFIKEILYPILDNCIVYHNEEIVYKFEIFWPTEIINIGVFSQFLKKQNPSAKVVIDFSHANEQFDFSQWVRMIQDNGKELFCYFDFFIINRDFGTGISDIMSYLRGQRVQEDIRNVIYIGGDGIPKFIDFETKLLNTDMLESFIKETFNPFAIGRILGERFLAARFLPYKCYWNNCNFCAINAQNKFVYDKEYGYEYFVDQWIQFIKSEKLGVINFNDEALPPLLVLSFAKRIIQEGIQIRYQFRTRFEKMYTRENCQLLWQSGARYCGMGLESAIDRVNQEIGNKGNDFLTLKDKIEIIGNFDEVGIPVHNYSIMGFPGESTLEASITFQFLKKNIEKRHYFTCTPNIFNLMKGPKIFREKEKFGIEIDEKDLQNPFNLSYNFTVDGQPRDMTSLYHFVQEIHRNQFLPWLEQGTGVDTRDFWDFLDRSYGFYLMKMYHRYSPYYTYLRKNDTCEQVTDDDIKAMYFITSPYLQVLETTNPSLKRIKNWVEEKEGIFPNVLVDFLVQVSGEVPLGEHMKEHSISSVEQIRGFIKNRFLLLQDSTISKIEIKKLDEEAQKNSHQK